MTAEEIAIHPVEVLKPSQIVDLPVNIDAIVKRMKDFEELKVKLLDKDDVVSIQGKPFIKRSGWRKFALAFNLTDEIIDEKQEQIEGGFNWRIKVRVSHPNGRSAVGVGSCSSNERKFSHVEHDVFATAHTRAKNRAISDIIGSGEVSAEEMAEMTKPEASPEEIAAREKAKNMFKNFQCNVCHEAFSSQDDAFAHNKATQHSFRRIN